MTITVLTSRENLGTTGVQEVLPLIENCWIAMNSADHEVVVLNIDQLALSDLTASFFRSDKIVITCFNYRMCKTMQYVRDILRLNVGLVIYVHHMATIAFWPYRYFASNDLFCQTDVFITSCQSDKDTLEKIFVKPTVQVIPFVLDAEENLSPLKKMTPNKNLIYLGPISPQKNIHTLLLAYSLLKRSAKENPPVLILFGKEDYLGSPNMNLRNDDYLKFLNHLVLNLELKKNVFFKGHVDQNQVADFLKDKSNLFVSASLQSDENFGLEACRALADGNPAVLSDWGGHSDLKLYFDQQVDLVPVRLAEYGPSLSAFDLFKIIKEALKKSADVVRQPIQKFTSLDYCIVEQKKAVLTQHLPLQLKFAELADQIYESKIDFTNSTTQIFSGFNDALFLEISKCYIGKTIADEIGTELSYSAVPWVTYNQNTFVIDDPHKGRLFIPNDLSLEKLYSIHLSNGLNILVSKETCERLYKNGFANPEKLN